jgi:hypothetical protein
MTTPLPTAALASANESQKSKRPGASEPASPSFPLPGIVSAPVDNSSTSR